jgi:hypothetical protein
LNGLNKNIDIQINYLKNVEQPKTTDLVETVKSSASGEKAPVGKGLKKTK